MVKGLTAFDGWNVMCNVSKVVIDVDKRCGHLYLPADNYPDMRSTINCFLSVDPECKAIYTYVDGKEDVMYLLDQNDWIAAYKATA